MYHPSRPTCNKSYLFIISQLVKDSPSSLNMLESPNYDTYICDGHKFSVWRSGLDVISNFIGGEL